MKFLAIVSSLLFSVNAFADISPTVISEMLPKVKVNGESKPGQVAQLQIDFVNKRIEVSVYNDICGHFAPSMPGVAKCMAMPVIVAQIEVPLQKNYESCGSKVYEGVADLRPVDGARSEIEVMDHTSRVCDDLRLSLLEVVAKSTHPMSSETTVYSLMK